MDRRKHMRFIKRLTTKFFVDHKSFMGISSDLSESGLFIRTNRGFAVNTPIDIQLFIPDNKVSLLKGIVRRTMRTPISSMKDGMGIEIIEKDGTFINFVKSIIGGNEMNTEENHATSESQIISCSNVEVENKVLEDNILEDNIKERRQHNRYKIDDRKINIKIELANEVKVIDLSIGGISLKTDKKLYLGKQYILKLGSKDRVIIIHGAVKWSSLSEYKKYSSHSELIPIYTAGMQFTNVSSNNLEELIQLIEGLTKIDADLDNIYHQNEIINLSEYLQEALETFGKTNDHTQDTSRDIRKKSIAEKRKTALFCGREERSILLKDPNKEVVFAVLENPKITAIEIEEIVKLRTIPEEVIKKIVQKREWMKNYGVVLAVVTNPKTPTHIAVSLIKKLKTKDLKIIERDKEVSETVRSVAKKLLYCMVQV